MSGSAYSGLVLVVLGHIATAAAAGVNRIMRGDIVRALTGIVQNG